MEPSPPLTLAYAPPAAIPFHRIGIAALLLALFAASAFSGSLGALVPTSIGQFQHYLLTIPLPNVLALVLFIAALLLLVTMPKRTTAGRVLAWSAMIVGILYVLFQAVSIGMSIYLVHALFTGEMLSDMFSPLSNVITAALFLLEVALVFMAIACLWRLARKARRPALAVVSMLGLSLFALAHTLATWWLFNMFQEWIRFPSINAPQVTSYLFSASNLIAIIAWGAIALLAFLPARRRA